MNPLIAMTLFKPAIANTQSPSKIRVRVKERSSYDLAAVRFPDYLAFQMCSTLPKEHFLVGFLRDPVVLRCASWCQLQRTPRGKLLKLLRLSSKVLRS